ncbi:MAG: hypothetical protein KatS3mg021_2146 [Fimbriimonadales bacterium]|nr:MAG: hypothetical protein KatS3mg021_2146 [Fimbriimonadales bacterium]
MSQITIDELVHKAEAIVADCFSQAALSAGSTGRTQLSNAIDAINQSGSVAVFCNWLRYQMSREDFWRTPGKNGSFVEQIYKYAQDLLRRDAENTVAHLTNFLGFARRALVALRYLEQIPPQLREVRNE